MLQLVLLVAGVVLIACAGCDHRKCAETRRERTTMYVLVGKIMMPIDTVDDVCVRYVEDGGR